MTDDEPQQEATADNHDRSGPLPSSTEQIFVRLTFWQTVLGVASVIIAILALYAALTESASVRHQTAAAVWPFIQLSVDDYDTGDTAGFRMSFTNAGVGPARMRDLRLIINGSPVRNWAHAVELLGGDPEAPVGRNFVNDRVMRPDETIDLITTESPDLARRFQASFADPANSIAYCYCSIFDECWLADSDRDLQNPEPIDQCPDFGDTAYRN